MLYELAHAFQSKFPWFWSVVEWWNGRLFNFRYGRRIEKVISNVLSDYPGIRAVEEGDVNALALFFESQPEESFRYFKPHGFGAKELLRLTNNPSFLMFLVEEKGTIAGYFFLRSYFIGKTYLGKMVDHNAQRQGFGKMICQCAMDLASSIGMRMFETISKDNLASLYSSQKVLEVNVIEEMSNGYLYIEDVRKRSEI